MDFHHRHVSLLLTVFSFSETTVLLWLNVYLAVRLWW